MILTTSHPHIITEQYDMIMIMINGYYGIAKTFWRGKEPRQVITKKKRNFHNI